MKQDYRPRVADALLTLKLEAMGAVLIEGAKYCGKTTMAAQQAKSELYMADPETKEQNMTMAKTNPLRSSKSSACRFACQSHRLAASLVEELCTAIEIHK